MTEEEKYSMDDIRDIVENEGLGYAIRHYLSPENIEDDALAAAWARANDAFDEIEAILGVTD